MAKFRAVVLTLNTAICFIFYGLGSLLLSLVIFPWLWLTLRHTEKRQERAQFYIHHSFRLLFVMMECLGIVKVSVQGKADLAHVQNKIIIANHPSLIDVAVMMATIPRVTCIVKKALWDNPFFAIVVRTAGYIKNEDPEALLAMCKHSLSSGQSLIVFPEGTRTRPNQALKFQRGAANIAVRCHVDFLALSIRCEPWFLSKFHPWHYVPPSRPNFQVNVLETLSVKDMYDAADPETLASRKVTKYLENYYQRLELKHA